MKGEETNVTFRQYVSYFYANLYFACVRARAHARVCVYVCRNRRRKDLAETCTHSFERLINTETVFAVENSGQKINETVATGFQTTKIRMLHEQQVIGPVNP
jgi:hypothetical protein